MITLSIPNISCAHCARAITGAVHDINPGAVVQVDVDARTVRIDAASLEAGGADRSAALEQLRDKLAAEGYPATAL